MAVNHLLEQDATTFEAEEISLKFLLEIMTLVSSVNTVEYQYNGILGTSEISLL